MVRTQSADRQAAGQQHELGGLLEFFHGVDRRFERWAGDDGTMVAQKYCRVTACLGAKWIATSGEPGRVYGTTGTHPTRMTT